MSQVIVSPKFQVVIPKAVRESVAIMPGQRVQVIAHGNRIELVPLRPMQELRGSLGDISDSVDRDADRL
jgi:AbrB family looped-hinge helix DNA binding protein